MSLMGAKEIMEIIPHRQPFMLIDTIEEMEEGKRVVAKKCVSYNEPFFAGHFPTEPVLSLIHTAGAKRCVPLKVSGPFHSPLLVGAGEKLAKELETVEIHDIIVPYIANVTADYVKDKADVKPLLEKQVSSSVKWQQTVERMIADGADLFVEIGPGKTLSGFMRKINRDVKVINIEKVEDLEKLS